MADAAMLDLKDRAPAQLTKDQLSVSKATSPVLHDKRLNSTRLYRTDVDGDEFVSGDNFNSVYKKYYADPNDYETSRGINPKQVAPVNDTMYLLKFDFGSSDKLPIILTNWRGHVTTVNRDKVPGSTRYAVSSDYVNAYRHALEYGCEVSFDPVNGYITDWTIGSTQKYRVAFFNDTGGSVNTGGFEKIIYHGSEGEVEQRANSWLKESVNTSRLKNKTGSYGTVLATLAQECLNDGLNEIPVSNGKIKTSKVDYYGEVKTTGITALAYAAAKACREAAAVKTVTYPYKYTDPETGEMFAVGSSFHADKIIGSWDSKIGAPETGTKKLTLTSFLLSREVAFLSIPGEPFDFLVKDITVTGEARTAPENNLWNSLIHEDTYGRPFVPGYCNGYQSYFPSYDAYVYNQGSTRWAVGSYEAHQARYQQGTAETVVRIYDKMLRDLAEGSGDLTYTGYCAHCGENQLWQPYNNETTLTLKSPTLEFKDMITVNAMFTAENIENVVEMGMITYKEKVEAVSVDTADHVIPGTAYDVNTGRYIAHSQGIHAKYLGDTVYLACYAKLTDGSYVYTKLAPYSPVQYATSQLKNATDVKLKKLVAAMLNYGTEAQLFFAHNVGVPANGSLTADQRALPDLYRADMAGAVPNASTGKQGVFANNQGFSKRYPAISFEGAFCINYFFKPNHTPVGDITLYYWNEADFAAADVLTAENSSGSMTLEPEDGGEYRGDIVGISAKNLSEAVYVAAVYSDGTTTWSSGVLGYSIGSYCSGQSAKGAEVAALAEATAVYGYHAKQYFG